MTDKYPSWRYGPDGAAKVFQSAAEVPADWFDHPSKVGKAAPQVADNSPQQDHTPAADAAAMPNPEPVVADNTALQALAEAAAEVQGIPLTRRQVIDALRERHIPWSKNAPTKALYNKLLEAVEAKEA